MSELTRVSWSERRKLAKAFRSAGTHLSSHDTRQLQAAKGMRILSRATEQERYEWVYWYALGDYCQELGFFDAALDACSCCYHLRPDDPRSTYALATAFRLLSDARLIGSPEAMEKIAQLEREGYQAPKPQASEAALTRLGLKVEEVVAGAVYFFTQTLEYVSGKDAEVVRSHLEALRRIFLGLSPEPGQECLAAALQYVKQHRP
jgi:hypothetical protein